MNNIYDIAHSIDIAAGEPRAWVEYLHIAGTWYCLLMCLNSRHETLPVSAGHGYNKGLAADWCFRNWLDEFGRGNNL